MMMTDASSNEVEEFLHGPLVSWLESSLPRPEILSNYHALLDGTILHLVWLKIDPEPQYHPRKLDTIDASVLPNARAKNFDCIIRNLRQLYEDELDQTILVLPDCSILGHSPESRAGLEQMKLLIILLLGAAVQCPNKEQFIGRIKELDVNTQHSIVELIKQVTDNQSLVLPNNNQIDGLTPENWYQHLIRLAKERDKYHSNWIASLVGSSDSSDGKGQSSANVGATVSTTSDSNHMAVELADLKSKLRKIRQELEEKSETYMEVKEELDHKIGQYEKLRTESLEWYAESRRSAAYRDEVDILRERVDRAERLEVEVQRLREKLGDAEFFRSRVDELREDNRTLVETKEMLEEQLNRSRKRSEQVMTLETELLKCKQKINDMALERDVDKARLQEIIDENTQLQLAAKNDREISVQSNQSDDDMECQSGDNSLSEQLTNNAQARAFKLELENRRLQQALDALRESTFHESANKLLELEKEKKKLSLRVEQLTVNCGRLQQQNQELETVFKNALDENRKLQDSIDSRQESADRQQQERDIDRQKMVAIEKQVETLSKEKQRIQTLCDSIQRRANDSERYLAAKTKECDRFEEKLKEFDVINNQTKDLENKLVALERDNSNLLKDVTKLRCQVEEKDVEIDRQNEKLSEAEKQMRSMNKELEQSSELHARIVAIETANKELESQRQMDRETIDSLRNELIDGTLKSKRLHKRLESIGIDQFEEPEEKSNETDDRKFSVRTVFEKWIQNPETFKTIKEIILTDQSGLNGCRLCHRQEIFTVEKEIEIRNSDVTSTTVYHRPIVLTKPGQSKVSLTVRLEDQCSQLQVENFELKTTISKLQEENALQKVDYSTQSSQIVSLNAQHVALQLANSQLASEKDLLIKEIDRLRNEREGQVQDQITLQCLHEQLSAEYDSLSKNNESLKSNLRDVRIENRNKDDYQSVLVKQIDEQQHQIDQIKKENEVFNNLRGEHSKLKDDFRTLFTTTERLKDEYKSIQERNKLIRSENAELILRNTELSGDLNYRCDQMKSMEMELVKTGQQCEMLIQMNASLDTDRRTLMEHVSQLLSQYHDLLTHSLEDKQHFHEEEKQFMDKVNNLYQQKGKLEEKIMEHYRQMDNCSRKKKPFGSSFVKRVKKAGVGFINKVPSGNRRSLIEDIRLTQSELSLGQNRSGNESDNSLDESKTLTRNVMNTSDISDISSTPSSIQSSIPSTIPSAFNRKSEFRQSLQRTNDPKLDSLSRGGVRNSMQCLRSNNVSISGDLDPNTKKERIKHRHSAYGGHEPDVTGSSLNLTTAGSRRTVYLIDNDSSKMSAEASSKQSSTTKPKLKEPTDQNNGIGSMAANSTTPTTTANSVSPSSTFLMYNRISNVIGGTTTTMAMDGSLNGSLNGNGDHKSSAPEKDNKTIKNKTAENAIWYEYGCV